MLQLIFFPTPSSAETVQATAPIPHSTEEKWLSRCPLKKDSLLGCLPLVTNECGIGLAVGGMRSVTQSSHWTFPTMGFLYLFCCCSAVPDKRKFAFRLAGCSSLSAGTVSQLLVIWLSPSIFCWGMLCAFRAERHCFAETRFQLPPHLASLFSRR